MSRCHPTFFCLLLISTLTSAQAELVLTNFTSAHPLKIMAVGDSITDDCAYNGAWRQYLQPLLETNGYAFTFIGREWSSASGSFTKTNHEGMCGAVIAPPGLMTTPVHGYAGTNVYLLKTVADALTNAQPDVVLVLIGVNDVGRGRDPGLTATNDMAHLLDLIFSNAPNANVIIAKVTSTLKAVNVGGLNYSTYAAKIPIYNAALQGLVNQRRSTGQNVFLADMYSVVDTATMSSDGLHPNPSGLQVVAGEWLTRIQSITLGGNPVVSVLVKGGDDWKYSDTGQDLGTNWMRPDFDDSGWSNGPARLGYGDKETVTTVSYGPVSTNKYPTTYFRHAFVVSAKVAFTNLVLRLAQRAGSVVWLNGQELYRTNLPATATYPNPALPFPAPTDSAYQFYSVNVDASKLVPGTNIIAEELHLLTLTAGFAGFDMELIGTGNRIGPALSLTKAGTNLVFAWPADTGGGFGLYSSTNLGTTNWIPNNTPLQTNAGQLVTTQAVDVGTKFFRLQKN